jgi:hypothetical protein
VGRGLSHGLVHSFAFALALAIACTIGSARAEDIASLRADGGLTAGPQLVAWDAGLGTSWDAWIDGFVLRLGGVVGMLSYPERDLTPALLIFTPEASVHFGRETALRVYYTLQLPIRLLQLEASYQRDWWEEWFLGARAGAELEQRDRDLGVRIRAGIFAGVLRRHDGAVTPGATLRLIVEFGKPAVPPVPPLPADRLCPGGKTPVIPGLDCPPSI